MKVLERVARSFRMSDEAWKRHANPWSVWTRFAAIPAMLLAIWTRTWIGWWCLVPIAAVVVWLWINPHAFKAIERPTSWAAKGIYGEKLWLHNRELVPSGHRAVLRFLVCVGSVGFALLIWGLVALDGWQTIFGATLVVLGQLWRIDRFGLLYEAVSDAAAAGVGQS